MKAYFYLLLSILLLTSCMVQEQVRELTPKEALTTALSTPVDDYFVTYTKTSSTSGSETTQTISVEVSDGKLIRYEEKLEELLGYHNADKHFEKQNKALLKVCNTWLGWD